MANLHTTIEDTFKSHNRYETVTEILPYTKSSSEEKCPMMIMAPLDEFDLSQLLTSTEEEAAMARMLMDPITVQPLNSKVPGCHIVAKWGEEASEPETINHLNQ